MYGLPAPVALDPLSGLLIHACAASLHWQQRGPDISAALLFLPRIPVQKPNTQFRVSESQRPAADARREVMLQSGGSWREPQVPLT